MSLHLRVKPENVRAMKLACAHLKYRFQAQEYPGDRYPYGRGVSVLLYGPPVTGKTDEEMRRLLWEDMLQDTELCENEKLLFGLAAFELSGSNIKSIVRNAVYIALMEQRKPDAADIAAALKIEYEKMGRMPDQAAMVSILC